MLYVFFPLPGDIIGADIVEYNPDRDVDFITGAVCAKLLKELTGKIVDCRLSRKDKI
jgi:arginase family enzyme